MGLFFFFIFPGKIIAFAEKSARARNLDRWGPSNRYIIRLHARKSGTFLALFWARNSGFPKTIHFTYLKLTPFYVKNDHFCAPKSCGLQTKAQNGGFSEKSRFATSEAQKNRVFTYVRKIEVFEGSSLTDFFRAPGPPHK